MYLWIIIAAAGILLVLFFLFVYSSLSLWFQALISNARVSLLNIVFMRFRKTPPSKIIEPKIMAAKAGLKLSTDQLESHYMAGGDVLRVVKALIAAEKAKIELKFDRAAAIDLAGRDILEAVQNSVSPKVIETPETEAVAKDGIQVIAVARVTIRANLDRLVGGAGEETILARVGEIIVSAIGSSDTHKEMMENPDKISTMAPLEKLSQGTAFDILSIDIVDIDLGKNVGAQLQIDQAEADKKVAESKAEADRAQAIADEQQMKARVQEMRAEVIKAQARLHHKRELLIQAEAEVPQALSIALKTGRLGVMDYYRIKNINADTRMRELLAKAADKGEEDTSET